LLRKSFVNPILSFASLQETAAAVKVQSIVRRNAAISKIEKEGKSTVSMRNRARSRRTKLRKTVASEDVPSILRFCGIGFLFGDATGEDPHILNKDNVNEYDNKAKELKKIEEDKRKYRIRKRSSEKFVEEFEVVDDVIV